MIELEKLLKDNKIDYKVKIFKSDIYNLDGALEFMYENMMTYHNVGSHVCREILYLKSSIEDNQTIESRRDFQRQLFQNGYRVRNGKIVYDKSIDIEIINYRGQTHFLVGNQITKIKEMGMGISKFETKFGDILYDIICTGRHPNVNPRNGSLCFDSDLKGNFLDLPLLEMVRATLCQINLDSSHYYPTKFNMRLEEIING